MPKFDNLLRLLSITVLLFTLQACSSDSDVLDDDRTSAELYRTAKGKMESGAYRQAIEDYMLLLNRFPFGPNTEQAILELAYSLYQSNEEEKALAQLNRFAKTYPTHPNLDYAMYLRGLVNFNRSYSFFDRFVDRDPAERDQEYAHESFNEFAELIRRFPESDYATDARQRMIFLQNMMARHELTVARYYMRRKAYIAAANRAKYVVEHYPKSPLIGDALAIMVDSYRQIDLKEPAEDTLAVLQMNFPDHPYLSGDSSPSDESGGFWSFLWPFGGDDD